MPDTAERIQTLMAKDDREDRMLVRKGFRKSRMVKRIEIGEDQTS